MEQQAEAKTASRPDPLTDQLRNAAILVVDDEPGIRNFLVKTLRPFCRQVAEAADAELATSALEQQRFDIVFVD